MADFCVDMLRDVLVIVVTVAMTASAVIVPVSCTTVVRACAIIDVAKGAVIGDVLLGVVNAFASLDANTSIWAPTTTALGCMPMLTSFEELSTCGWGACSC